MTSRSREHHRSARVHAVILTRDRRAELQRCVNTALATLGPDDALTVLDDSCASLARMNNAMLEETARRSKLHVTHLVAAQMHEAIAKASPSRVTVTSRTEGW